MTFEYRLLYTFMMEENDIPIFKKLYELYKLIHLYRISIPKADRYTIWQRGEDTCLELLELVIGASLENKERKAAFLKKASTKLNLLRVFIRLAKDTKAIDQKKYLALQTLMDEIGRMLGGWLKSTKLAPPLNGDFSGQKQD